MIVTHTLKAPPDIQKSLEKDADRIDALLRQRKVKLSPADIDKIERDIDKKLQAHKTGTKKLLSRLVKWNDMMEGVVQDTNFPFVGSSNITIHYTAGISRTFRSTFNKTMYQDEDLFIPRLDPSVEMPQNEHQSLQDGFNYTFSERFNGLDILKDATIPGVRDGTVIVSGSWERRVETCVDTRTYKNHADFIKDYPDAEAAGVSEDAYRGILDQFIVEPDAEVIIDFKYDFVKFDGIRYKINSLANFKFFPLFARSISDMELYGSEYPASERLLKSKKKSGEFRTEGVDKVITRKGDQQWGEWERARSSIEGLSMGEEDQKPYKLCDLVYKADLDDNGTPEKYIVTYAPEAKALLSIQPYPIRRNIDICVGFRMVARDNRFLGVSLVGDCEDLFDMIDLLHRHRNNIRMLTTAPVFLAQKNYKELIDMGRAENVIRPGLTLWVDDIEKAVKQLQIQNLDQPGNSMDEEMVLTRYVELVFGPTQGLSGSQTPTDPKAPARKTQMLLMQANQRIDDYMDEWRKSLPDLAELHAALLYQYSPERDLSFDRKNTVSKFPLQHLANAGIKWMPKRRSVQLTPEFAMARMQSLVAIYLQLLPLLMRGDPMAVEMWNRQVKNSGEPEADKLVIDKDKAAQMQQQSRAMMLQQIQQQMEMKAQAKGKESMAASVGKHIGKRVAEHAVGTGKESEAQGLNQLAQSTGPGV